MITKQASKSLVTPELETKPPGWCGKPNFHATTVHGKPCRRGRMYVRDFMPGTTVVGTRCIERVGATDDEVNDKLKIVEAALRAKFPGGAITESGHRVPTVHQALETYMNLKVRNGLKASSTASEYERHAAYVAEKLGPDMLLDDLTSEYIQVKLYEPGRKRSKERLEILSRAIKIAQTSGNWTGERSRFNPVAIVEKPMARKDEAPVTIERDLIPDEKLRTLLHYVDEQPYWLAFFYLLTFAGPRIDEVFHLRRDQYDPKEGTLLVTKAVTIGVRKAKTKSGVRFIVLGAEGRALIEALLAYHAARGYTGPWLFPAILGGKQTHPNFNKAFLPLMLAAGLAQRIEPGPCRTNPDRQRTQPGIEPDFTAHEFRHTAATRDRDTVPPMYLDAQLGHKNATRIADPNAAKMEYANPAKRGLDPSLFGVRRKYAEIVDEQVRALLKSSRLRAQLKAA